MKLMQSDCNIPLFLQFVNMEGPSNARFVLEMIGKKKQVCYNRDMKTTKITNVVINQAIDYILEHINEDISLEAVAEHCHFSMYYFSRMFKLETGESVYAFIKRMKLEQSAFRLKIEPHRTVTDIGLDFGYSASNYSSAFRKQHRINPASFRKGIYQRTLLHPFFHMRVEEMETFEECSRKIEIKEVPDFWVLYERRIGNYHDLSGNWKDFLAKYQSFITERTLFLERTFDDPSITDMDGCIYDICMTLDPDCTLENTCRIRGGKCAVYPFKGLAKHIYAAYQTVFHVWLPQTNYELDDRCGFDIYHMVDSNSMYMELDICLPIRQLVVNRD